MVAEHGFLVGEKLHEKIVPVHVGVGNERFLVDALVERLLKHVQKLVHERQLQDFLVDNSEDDLELLVDLPLQ